MKVSEQTYTFIREHVGEPPAALRLKYSGKKVEGVDISLALTQIEARRKASSKLPELLSEHEEFLFPDTLSAEQCTSWPLACLHGRIAGQQSDVLDLTCGLGIDTLALAGSSERVTTCDLNATHIDYVTHNSKVLGLDNIRGFSTESGAYLAALADDKYFSLIFADPARRSATNKRIFALEDCSPDITALLPIITAHTDRLLLKVSPMLDADRLLNQLPGVHTIYAISLRGECKELLVDCRFDEEIKTTKYSAIDILTNGHISEYTFEQGAMHDDVPIVGDIDCIKPGQYMFEPNASLMKFLHKAPLMVHYSTLRKLGINTHIYISDAPLPSDMPGRILQIEKVLSPSKKAIKEMPQYANIVTRNYPESAANLKSKMKVKEGGEHFLYACRIHDKTARLLLCTPLK
ncbi:MAG: class I SAM-dependent methyltransferase [Muribaculaceae bacterium]|nr:class I SAM-dependent methyltransferase [Muribaculaceae bacterium]